MYLRSQRLRGPRRRRNTFHQLERVGESEWTPWIAIAGLILSFAAVGLLTFGIVEGAWHLLASASFEG